MRTQWTAKENRDAGSSCSCDRGLRRYHRNFGGVWTPQTPPPLGTPLIWIVYVELCVSSLNDHAMYILHLTSNISSPQLQLIFHAVLAKLNSHSRIGVWVRPLSYMIQPSGNSHIHASECKCHVPGLHYERCAQLTLNIPSIARQRCLPSCGPRRTPLFFFFW